MKFISPTGMYLRLIYKRTVGLFRFTDFRHAMKLALCRQVNTNYYFKHKVRHLFLTLQQNYHWHMPNEKFKYNKVIGRALMITLKIKK